MVPPLGPREQEMVSESDGREEAVKTGALGDFAVTGICSDSHSDNLLIGSDNDERESVSFL